MSAACEQPMARGKEITADKLDAPASSVTAQERRDVHEIQVLGLA
jgi:hypothetical protein